MDAWGNFASSESDHNPEVENGRFKFEEKFCGFLVFQELNRPRDETMI
jgi:hypothetical protein